MNQNNERSRVEKSKIGFKENLVKEMEKLIPNIPVKVQKGHAEGPTITLSQNDEFVTQLSCYYGRDQDYTHEYITLAKQTLKEHQFIVE